MIAACLRRGFGLLATRYSISNMVYLGLMDLTGSALTSRAPRRLVLPAK
jgi:hypothetical protein